GSSTDMLASGGSGVALTALTRRPQWRGGGVGNAGNAANPGGTANCHALPDALAAIRCRRANVLFSFCHPSRPPPPPPQGAPSLERATPVALMILSATGVARSDEMIMRATLHDRAPNTYYGQWLCLFLRE